MPERKKIDKKTVAENVKKCICGTVENNRKSRIFQIPRVDAMNK